MQVEFVGRKPLTYQFQIPAYEKGHFQGLGDMLEESEIDVYVPVEKVA